MKLKELINTLLRYEREYGGELDVRLLGRRVYFGPQNPPALDSCEVVTDENTRTSYVYLQ